MDLAAAYPPAAKVKSWVRTVRLNRGGKIEITEAFELLEAAGETTLNFLTPREVDATQTGQIILRGSVGSAQPSHAMLDFDDAKLAPGVERIELTDARLARSWGSHLNRLILRARTPTLKDTWTLRITAE
jgi:hypothetical protein